MDYMEHGHVHKHTLFDELMCHFPYAVFSVAFCLTVLSFIGFFTLGNTDPQIAKKGAKMLFHIGPLRFDVAFKIKRPDPSISRYAWYLSLGHAF